ncbi:hypothetical protein TRFO_37380 [Tritrichomonas foetus]|uniref:DUF4455 domain-containing protein n=1 Tax=Tritrichomonas foetus TaxID=1144522 RepID=A0A1J4JG63_9EUKA|nr:hypothetical protein TRFO_37380 [Tritrichomonas foetus]|eukprot:OHS96437.1 hypothetical protein TRFO_37380 [Tritrichomonas foetus]
MNEVAILPKNAPSLHSTQTGHLKRYQEKLTQKYLEIIGFLQHSAEESSKKTSEILQSKMEEYQKEKQDLMNQQREFIESMGKNATNFEQLKLNLESIGNEMIKKSICLREESIEIYDKSFASLQPIVNESFKKCEIFVSQLPANLPFRLETVVQHLNESYITTKSTLLRSLFNEEIDARNIAADASEEFVQRSDEWCVNKFTVLVEEAKERLVFQKLCDFGTIFTDFYKDQKKFTLCFKKVLQNVMLIMPPDSFSTNDFDTWWKEAHDIMTFHSNFIDTFLKKIEDKINETKNNNIEYIENLEKELNSLKSETEANQAMSEIIPLFKQCRKYSENFLSKLRRYWENRSNAIQSSFDSIKAFIMPIIEIYQNCINKSNESKSSVIASQKELRDNSTQLLSEYENDIAQHINEIQLLVTEKDIKNAVDKCKSILDKIESEYRTFYDKAIKIYDDEQPKVLQVFESTENELLQLTKLRKTSISQDWIASMGSARSNSKLNTPQSMRRQKRPNSRAVKKRAKKGKEDEKVEIFHFELENGGGKYEETEMLTIIPPVEEFIDEATLPPIPVKGKGARGGRGGGRGANTRGSRGGRGGGRGGANSNNSGKIKPNIDDIDDVEVPDFVLFETVPKINDEDISIIVYTPQNVEIEEWKNNFRKALVKSFMDLYAEQITFTNYDHERDMLADELNERMRTHTSRGNSIELNVGQTRLIRLESRKVQLEKHFRKATLIFNKGLKGIETNIDKKTAELKNEASKLHSFIEELEKQKTSQTFQQLNQEFTIKLKNFSVKVVNQMEIQKKEIDEFITNFKASNDRFVNTLGGADEVFSDEERDMCLKFFERMNVQIEQIVEALNNKETEIKNGIDDDVKAITDEFNNLFPHHRNDMIFVDAMQAAQVEAKSKLDSLIFRNKQNEADVTRAIEKVKQSRDPSDDPQLAIEKEFESLENMRMTILSRARFLNILKSKISTDPIAFQVILGNELTEAEKQLSDIGSARKSIGRSRQGTNKIRPDSAKRMAISRKSGDLLNDSLQTIQGKIEIIGSEMISKLTPSINEYYTSLKTRKHQITRPEKIPALPAECIEKNKNRWQQTMSVFPSIYEECCRVFRNQVASAIEVAKDSVPYVYALYNKFYILHQNELKEKLFSDFNEEFKLLVDGKQEHRNRLTPRIIDENNTDELLGLIEEENIRKKNEAELVKNFNENVLNSEVKTMQLFIGHLPLITRTFLQTFDAFVLPEDLVNGTNGKDNQPPPQVENATRMTLKEMLKEKERRANNPVNDPFRPFPQKAWPSLNVQMMPLVWYMIKPSEITTTQAPPTARRQSRRRREDRKRDEKKGITSSSSDIAEVDKLPVQYSLETPLHRCVIFERNKSYSDYETALADRVDKFKSYVTSLEQDLVAFDKYWRRCIVSMKPGFKFPDEVPPPSRNEKHR